MNSNDSMIFRTDGRTWQFIRQEVPPFSRREAYLAYCEWHRCEPEVPMPPWERKYLDAWRRKYVGLVPAKKYDHDRELSRQQNGPAISE